MPRATINVTTTQADITIFGADALRDPLQNVGVLSHADLIAELVRLKDAGATTNADLARLLALPTSRVAEFFNGKRRVTVDEAKRLVDHFGLEGGTTTPSAETIEPMLDALLPLVPPGRVTDQSRRALAEALSYALGWLHNTPATQDAEGMRQGAARAAAVQFLARVQASSAA